MAGCILVDFDMIQVAIVIAVVVAIHNFPLRNLV